MTRLLDDGCSINAKDPSSGKTALHVAVETLDSQMVKLLTDLGADVNAKDASDRTSLALLNNFADEDNSLDILEVLLDKKVELTSCAVDGTMQMYSILTNGSAEAVQLVMKCEFNVSVLDQRKHNILHYLAKNVNKGIVSIIQEKNILDKVDLNKRDQDGNTPLHYAMSYGNADFVECLIEKRATWNIENNKGLSPFLQAIDSSGSTSLKTRINCLNILLKNRVEPHILLGQYFNIYNTKLAIKRDYDLLEPIIAMLALWKANNTAISEDVLDRMESYPKLKEHYDICTSELNRMKSEILYGHTSLFDYVAFNEDGSDLHPLRIRYVSIKIYNLAKNYQTHCIYREILDKCVDLIEARKRKDYRGLPFLIIFIIAILLQMQLLGYLETYYEEYQLYISLFRSFIASIEMIYLAFLSHSIILEMLLNKSSKSLFSTH